MNSGERSNQRYSELNYNYAHLTLEFNTVMTDL